MGYTKYEIVKFDGTGDFGLWKQKIYSLLVQQDVSEGIADSPEYPKNSPELSKKKLLEKAYTSIILNLAGNVIRQVNKEKTALQVWKKLDELFLVKSLSSRISLKVQLIWI